MSLWQKVALRDAGPHEVGGEGDLVPIDLVVATELDDSLSRPPSGPRTLTVRSGGPSWSTAAAHALAHPHAAPGLRVASTEPHITALGAWGMAGFHTTPLVLHEAWTRGVLSVGVPRTVRIHANGPLPSWLGPLDLVLHLVAEVGFDGYVGAVLEFGGDAVEGLPPFLRAELLGAAAMTNCLTALAALDAPALAAAQRGGMARSLGVDALGRFRPDEDAVHRELAVLNPDRWAPMAAEPIRGAVGRLAAFAGRAVERVLVGGCLGGDLASLDHLATRLEEARVAPEVRFVAVADSAATHHAAADRGLAQRLEASGAALVPWDHLPPERGLGATLTTNPCLAPRGIVASLPSLVASAAAGRVRTPGGAPAG